MSCGWKGHLEESMQVSIARQLQSKSCMSGHACTQWNTLIQRLHKTVKHDTRPLSTTQSTSDVAHPPTHQNSTINNSRPCSAVEPDLPVCCCCALCIMLCTRVLSFPLSPAPRSVCSCQPSRRVLRFTAHHACRWRPQHRVIVHQVRRLILGRGFCLTPTLGGVCGLDQTEPVNQLQRRQLV